VTADPAPPSAADLTDRIRRSMPFAALLEVEVTSADPAELRSRMQWKEERTTGGGVMHGGALVAFADSVGALCAGLNAQGPLAGTLELKCNFLRPVTGGWVHAVSRPIHAGRATVVVQTELFDEGGRRVALVTQTQAARRMPPE
jgi:1,4-dihydroxy-2-naphthoyl-CoA hydrolase